MRGRRHTIDDGNSHNHKATSTPAKTTNENLPPVVNVVDRRHSTVDAGMQDLKEPKDEATQKVMQSFWFKANLILRSSFAKEKPLQNKLAIVLLVMMEAYMATLDIFQILKKQKKMLTKDIYNCDDYVALQRLQEKLTELSGSNFFFVGNLDASKGKRPEHNGKLTTTVEAPLMLLEERFSMHNQKLIPKLFTAAPGIKTIRKEVQRMYNLPAYYNSLVVLLYIAETLAKGSVQTLQYTDLRHTYLTPLVQSFQCSRSLIWAELRENHNLDLSAIF